LGSGAVNPFWELENMRTEQSSDLNRPVEPETMAAAGDLAQLSADKSRFFRRRAKPVSRVTQHSIDLACEEFFRSRALPRPRPFIGKATSGQDREKK